MPLDVLLIVCDTARADAFSPWGGSHPSPSMEKLCREGLHWSRAISPAPWTVPSHASMFSGLLPTEHGINGACIAWTDRKPSSPAEAVRAFAGTWLPEQMAARGYRTWGASCNSWVSQWGGFDRGFDEFLDLRPWTKPKRTVARYRYLARKALGRMDRGGGEAVKQLRRRLAGAGSAPEFLFLNLMETHSPFDPPSPYYPYPFWRRFRTRHLAGGPDQGLSYNTGVVDPGPEYARMLRDIYFGCGRYEDRILGELISVVREKGRPTVVVVVADHGENLGEHGMYNHNSSLNEPLLHVPLVAWGSGVEVGGEPTDEPVSTARVGAWMIGLVDGDGSAFRAGSEPVVSEYEGTHLHNGIPDSIREGIERTSPRVPPLVFNAGLAVHRGSRKLTAAANGERAVFDLGSDPGEERDLLSSDPSAAAAFDSDLDAWESRRGQLPSYAAGDVAEGEIAEHLRELGYIE